MSKYIKTLFFITFISLSLFLLSTNILRAASINDSTSSDASALGLLVIFATLVFFGIFALIISLIQLLVFALSIAGMVLWVWMLIDLIQRDNSDFPNNIGKDAKIIWVLILVFTGVIGSLIYYLLVFRNRPIKKIR